MMIGFVILTLELAGLAVAAPPRMPRCKPPAEAARVALDDGLWEVGCVVATVRQGLWRQYDALARVVEEGHYERGQKHGTWTGYDERGKRAWTASWKHGVEDGPWRRYDHGKLQREAHFVAGKLEGLSTWFHPNGKKQSIETYVQGQLDGASLGYDERGHLRFEANYKAGQLHGWKRERCPDGRLFYEGRYENGQLVEGGTPPPPDKIPCSEYVLP